MCECLGILQQGNHAAADRLLVLAPHEQKYDTCDEIMDRVLLVSIVQKPKDPSAEKASALSCSPFIVVVEGFQVFLILCVCALDLGPAR